MRIADVLREQDDGDNPLPPFTSKSHCSSPTAAGSSSCRSLLSKWFRNRRKRAPAASGGERVVHRSAADGILIGRVDSCGRLPEIDLSSGVKAPPNEVAFNLGMGIGMAFLLAGNGKEMNKMVELRSQMEMLVKEIKAEAQRREDGSSKASSDVSEDAISTTISAEQNSSSSLDMEETKHFTQFHGKNYQSADKLRAMDQLEVELRVELDRMELNFGGVAGKHLIEMKSKELELSSGSSGSAWYDRMPDENREQQHGICAYDLERRLHELLQTRQQERIEALESALELAQRELHEKEDELCYWKKIVGGLIPENEETYFSLSFK